MKRISKRYKELIKKVDNVLYAPEQAVEVLRTTATAKFEESAEAHVSLNIDPKYADQQLRATVIFPFGTGKKVRVVAIVKDAELYNAAELKAEKIGSDSLIEEINQGYLDFDVLIAQTEMMPKLAKLGRLLGPRGLMPSAKAGTMTNDVKVAISEFKKGKIEYRVDKTGIVHVSFGKVNFQTNELIENLRTFYRSIADNKPSGVKGRYFKSFHLCSTMGPSIEVDCTAF
jgi:large subunit ribosomal protein L1